MYIRWPLLSLVSTMDGARLLHRSLILTNLYFCGVFVPEAAYEEGRSEAYLTVRITRIMWEMEGSDEPPAGLVDPSGVCVCMIIGRHC